MIFEKIFPNIANHFFSSRTFKAGTFNSYVIVHLLSLILRGFHQWFLLRSDSLFSGQKKDLASNVIIDALCYVRKVTDSSMHIDSGATDLTLREVVAFVGSCVQSKKKKSS